MANLEGKHFSITDPKDVSTVIYKINETEKEYQKDSKKYKCVVECGPYGKLNYYNYVTKTIIEEISISLNIILLTNIL